VQPQESPHKDYSGPTIAPERPGEHSVESDSVVRVFLFFRQAFSYSS
jgi:hypothetical protein